MFCIKIHTQAVNIQNNTFLTDLTDFTCAKRYWYWQKLEINRTHYPSSWKAVSKAQVGTLLCFFQLTSLCENSSQNYLGLILLIQTLSPLLKHQKQFLSLLSSKLQRGRYESSVVHKYSQCTETTSEQACTAFFFSFKCNVTVSPFMCIIKWNKHPSLAHDKSIILWIMDMWDTNQWRTKVKKQNTLTLNHIIMLMIY